MLDALDPHPMADVLVLAACFFVNLPRWCGAAAHFPIVIEKSARRVLNSHSFRSDVSWSYERDWDITDGGALNLHCVLVCAHVFFARATDCPGKGLDLKQGSPNFAGTLDAC